MKSFPRLNSLIILAVLCFISFFAYREVVEVDLMEARNFVTAREMVTENHWLIPTMNGEIRLEKPPMPTWLAAWSSKLSGTRGNLAVLRLPNALAGCLLIFSFYGLSQAINRNSRQAFLSAAMLVTSVLVIDAGRTGSWDIFCHAFMVAALWGLWAGVENRAGIWSFVAAGICLGLSFMSKGPVSFYALFLPAAIAYGYFYGFKNVKRSWQGLALALVICLCISAWWPLYIVIRHSAAGMMVAQKESDAWASRHVEPWWYYWHFLAFTGVWLVLAFAALCRPYSAERSENRRAQAFFLLWLAAALIMLSLIPEKKERYLLPAMIPLFLMTGDLVNGVIERFSKKLDQWTDRDLVLAHTSLVSLLSILLPFVLGFFMIKRGQAIDKTLIAYGVAFWGIAYFLIRLYRQRQVLRLMLVSLAFLSLATLAVMQHYTVLTCANSELKRIDSQSLDREIGSTKVYLLGNPVDMRIIWDLGRRAYPWQAGEVSRMLDQGAPVAVLSKGAPLPLLPKELQDRVTVQTLDILDYNKKHPSEHKIHLSLLQKTTNSTPLIP
jgi:4-amino-4-deoxy-L-arabinose transferase-like glycosyltransferase